MSIFVAAVDGMTSHDAGDVTRLETIFLTQEGVVGETGDDLKVEAQDTPDMTVKVNPGSCFVLRDAYSSNTNELKFWKVVVDANTNVTIPTSDPSDARIDLICVKVDTGASPDATASNVATLVNVEGTPAGSPSAPAVPNNHLKLAEVSVPASDTTIESGQITDYRTFIGLQLPYNEGYRNKNTQGNLGSRFYEDSAGNPIIESGISGGSLKIDLSQNKLQHKGKAGDSYSDVGDVTKTGSETLTNKTLDIILAYFNSEVDNGNSGASKTIDWGSGNKQKITLTDDASLTFTDPPGPCSLILVMVQDGTGSRNPSWPASVKWTSNGTEPTWSTGAGDIDIVAFYFDGTNYYGEASTDFA